MELCGKSNYLPIVCQDKANKTVKRVEFVEKYHVNNCSRLYQGLENI